MIAFVMKDRGFLCFYEQQDCEPRMDSTVNPAAICHCSSNVIKYTAAEEGVCIVHDASWAFIQPGQGLPADQ